MRHLQKVALSLCSADGAWSGSQPTWRFHALSGWTYEECPPSWTLQYSCPVTALFLQALPVFVIPLHSWRPEKELSGGKNLQRFKRVMRKLKSTVLTCCWWPTTSDSHFVGESQSHASRSQHQRSPPGFSEGCHQTRPGKFPKIYEEKIKSISVIYFQHKTQFNWTDNQGGRCLPG